MYTGKVERKDEYAIIVTFGLTILLTNLALVVFGPFSKSPPAFLQGTFIAGPLILPYDRLIAAVIAVCCSPGLPGSWRALRWDRHLTQLARVANPLP